jgi:hypothetical protein
MFCRNAVAVMAAFEGLKKKASSQQRRLGRKEAYKELTKAILRNISEVDGRFVELYNQGLLGFDSQHVAAQYKALLLEGQTTFHLVRPFPPNQTKPSESAEHAPRNFLATS